MVHEMGMLRFSLNLGAQFMLGRFSTNRIMCLQVDYSQFALFFRFKKTPWADSITIHWEIDLNDDSKRPHHPTDSEWWVPDYPRTKVLPPCFKQRQPCPLGRDAWLEEVTWNAAEVCQKKKP